MKRRISPNLSFELIFLLTKNPKRIIWAYDEFQSLNDLRIKEPEDLFGKNLQGLSNIKNQDLEGQYLGGIDKDFILPNSYRNPRRSLMAAHGIGLGLYRPEGIVDILSDMKSWKALGYEVLTPKSAVYKEGDKMDIERPEKYSRNILESLLRESGKSDAELLKLVKFPSSDKEYRFVAQEIDRLISKEGFEPEQIIVISLATSSTKSKFANLRQLLDSLGVKSISPGFVEGPEMFQEKGFVTITTPFRAKGNESEVVLVIDAENIISNYSFSGRNAAFVAITRSRGLCYLIGAGERMDKLEEEYTNLVHDYPHFKFDYPAEEDIERRRIVVQKSATELEKSGLEIDRIIAENPELLIEIIKNNPELLSKIKKNES